MQFNRRLKFVLSANALLLVPFTAMLFTAQVNWSFFDFVVMGLMLSILALSIEWATRKFRGRNAWILIAGALLIFVLLWAEMAVGLFGSPIAGS
jgi:hypothetical protein